MENKAYIQEMIEDRNRSKVFYCSSGVVAIDFDKAEGSRSTNRSGRLTNTPKKRQRRSIG